MILKFAVGIKLADTSNMFLAACECDEACWSYFKVFSLLHHK